MLSQIKGIRGEDLVGWVRKLPALFSLGLSDVSHDNKPSKSYQTFSSPPFETLLVSELEPSKSALWVLSHQTMPPSSVGDTLAMVIFTTMSSCSCYFTRRLLTVVMNGQHRKGANSERLQSGATSQLKSYLYNCTWLYLGKLFLFSTTQFFQLRVL